MIISISPNSENRFDLVPANDDKLTWLNSAITISLFTDARADNDDVLPDDSQDKRGYWGDMDLDSGESLGSKLWLLQREKITQQTLNKMQSYILEALQWLIDEDHLLAVQVTVERDTESSVNGDPNRVNFLLDCQLPNGDWVSIFRAHQNAQSDN